MLLLSLLSCTAGKIQLETVAGPGGFVHVRYSPQLEGIQELALGLEHACARNDQGHVICWGAGRRSQLGYELDLATYTQDAEMWAPKRVKGLGPVTQLAAGLNFTCALTEQGQTLCWGDNERGELGDDTITHRHTPAAPPEVFASTAIAASWNWACAVGPQGVVQCWGDRPLQDSLGESHHPKVIEGLTAPDRLVLYPGAGFAWQDEVLYAWGLNRDARLGSVGVLQDQAVVLPELRASTVISHDGSISCGADAAGALTCVGKDQARRSPTDRTGVVQLASGEAFTCALYDDGDVLCDGDLDRARDVFGRRGQVQTAIEDARSVVAGHSFACAVSGDDTGWCWGPGFGAQATPVFQDVQELVAGPKQVCARKLDNTVRCAMVVPAGREPIFQGRW